MRQKNLFLFIGVIVYKLATEWGYCYILSINQVTYPLDFNVWKYINGWLWCLILFFCIRHEKRKASVFMLYLLYVSQIVPITCVYALANDSAVYYNLTCFAVLNAELLLGWTDDNVYLRRRRNWSSYMVWGFNIVLLLLLLLIFLKNGQPTLIALDIYKVYELRGSGIFKLNKYENYLLSWMTGMIIPFLIAKYMDDRNYIKAVMLCGIIFILYLYTGQKTLLFSIPLVIFCSLWMKKKEIRSLYTTFMLCFALLVILACYSPVAKNIFFEVYHLIGRRVFLLSAVNKFKYYDFFSYNPKMGMAGIFPRWILNIPDPYEGEMIGKIISSIYYYQPGSNSNTGFLAEGYMRFGYIGIFVGMWCFAFILRLMDKMQRRTNLCLTVSAFVYPVLMLTDSHLIDSFVFGKYMVMVIIMLVFGKAKNDKCSERANKYHYKIRLCKKYYNANLRKYHWLHDQSDHFTDYQPDIYSR